MIVAPFRVVLDANVLYPFTLRDTLLRAADRGLYQLYWSEQILDEALRNLIADGRVTAENGAKLRGVMMRAFPEATVSGYETLVAAMKNDPKDRHVAAVASKVGAQVIVTMNLKDFTDLPEGIEAITPDGFLLDLLDLEPDVVIDLLVTQAESMKRPPLSFAELLDALAKSVPEFARAVRERNAD